MKNDLEKQKRKAAKLTNPKPVLRPSGKWRCQVMYKGKRYSVEEDDPEIAHTKALAIKNGIIEEEKREKANDMTVGEAIDRYISVDCGTLEESTLLNYESMRRNHLQSLMNVKLFDLTQEKIQVAINSMARIRSPKTVRNAYTLLTAALSIYLPSFRDNSTLPKPRKAQIRIPSNDDIQKIIAAAEGKRAERPILFGALLGLRMSEIRGLTWDCIENGRVHIKQAIVKGRNGDYKKKPKSYDSDRWLTLPDILKEKLSKAPHDSEYITTLNSRQIYGSFVRICDDLGLPHFRFHDLRHYMASVMLALNVPDKYAEKRMGHSTNHMLKTVYEHLMSDKEIEVDTTIENFFNSKLHPNLHPKF